MPNAKDGRRFTLHVVGISHKNENGSSRQRVIRNCSRGEAIDLVPEPDNKFDSNAIKVCRGNGEQIGYIDAMNASRLSREMSRGSKYRVTVDDILHKEGTKSYGLMLQLEVLTTSHASAALLEEHGDRLYRPDEIPSNTTVIVKMIGFASVLAGLFLGVRNCTGNSLGAGVAVAAGMVMVVAGIAAMFAKFKQPSQLRPLVSSLPPLPGGKACL